MKLEKKQERLNLIKRVVYSSKRKRFQLDILAKDCEFDTELEEFSKDSVYNLNNLRYNVMEFERHMLR